MMKRQMWILVGLYMLTASAALAQNSNLHALGLRFGGGDGVGTEISYQQFIGGPNRLEFDLGIYNDGWNDGFKATVLYQWMHPLVDGFDWYVGAGGGIGSRDIDNNHPVFDDDDGEGMFIDAAGVLGLEYNFPIPLQLSLDLRPEIGLINDDFDMGFGLGVRYSF